MATRHHFSGNIGKPLLLHIIPFYIDLIISAQAGAQQGEQELATKMLQIQSKRFYLDVKQNRRGRFIKVAEIGADGRRSQVYLALSTAAEFRDHLSTFSDYYASLGPPNPDNLPEDGKLKSEMMIKDNRRYYLDLKENARGRFLRVSQTITRGGPRSQIAIPAQGMIEFRDALTDLLEEFGTNDGGYVIPLVMLFTICFSLWWK
ncbi:transcriptional activator protein Pur-beta [Bactrocera tryoni]|uniref:transcriptional activator protein Pur-beta n=1 Tax=Bactrocera tryoni TaxID=59916 RepID=UPI001A968A50|nr:transcriptional activator protein Pur-beta [Bactrocera tryoni]